MAVIGDYGNRLAIVARQHALNRAAPVRLEGDPLANAEFEHIRVGADVLQQTKALDDPMVEVDQFGFRQPVNVDHHEASPSALNGVSTLQRPAGKRKPRNAQAASVMAVLSEWCWQEYCSYPGTLPPGFTHQRSEVERYAKSGNFKASLALRNVPVSKKARGCWAGSATRAT